MQGRPWAGLILFLIFNEDIAKPFSSCNSSVSFFFFFFAAGPRLGNSPVPSIVQCLARKDGSDDFYQLKVSHVKTCRSNVIRRAWQLFTVFMAWYEQTSPRHDRVALVPKRRIDLNWQKTVKAAPKPALMMIYLHPPPPILFFRRS